MAERKKTIVKVAKEKIVSLQEGIKKKIVLGTAPISHGTGRRKSSVARVWLYDGDGVIVVNNVSPDRYFHTDVSRKLLHDALTIVGAQNKFSIKINVHGGGVHSQAGAVSLGIARALALYKDEYRVQLRAEDLLTADARRKERKKYGQRGARRRFQFVKR